MICARIERLLSEQADGPLSPEKQQFVDEHLLFCRACNEFRSRLQSWNADLGQLRTSSAAVAPSGLSLTREAMVARQHELLTPRGFGARRSFPAAALAACAAAAAVAAFQFGAPRPTPAPSGHSTEQVSATPSVRAGNNSNPSDASQLTGQHRLTSVTPNVDSIAASPNSNRVQALSRAPLEPVASIPIKDDIRFVNLDAGSVPGRWARLLPDENGRLQAELLRSVRGGDDFVSVPLPRLAGISSSSLAAARRAWQAEKEIVDARLIRKVSASAKGVSFTELCKRWREETGIEFSANRSVADDKVTLFCKDKPLREIMRQITQVFGFLWRRSGDPDKYQYELYQDLRSQLIEEELRNKDRNEALMALDHEMEKYRKYLDLSPDQAREKAASAGPDDKAILDQLGGTGWAAAHLYFGLSGDQMGALRAGQSVEFGSSPENGQQELPQSLRSGVLQSMPNAHIYQNPNGGRGLVIGGNPPPGSNSSPLSSFPDASTNASLRLNMNDLGQMELEGGAGFGISDGGPNNRSAMAGSMSDNLAVGVSPSVKNPENGRANKDLARDSSLAEPVQTDPDSRFEIEAHGKQPGGKRLTSADVLEAVHKKTGASIVADYFSHLFDPAQVTVTGKSLFEALNRSCDAMRTRWTKADGWLRFRSASFFNDRLKEIPNRLLERWQESRKANGMLTADDLSQIASLTDAQLNSNAGTEAVKTIYGLKEWDLGATLNVRQHWRLLASMPSALRKAVWGEKGISFSQMPVAIQQGYIKVAVGGMAERGNLQIADLADATMKVEFPYPAQKVANPDLGAPVSETQPDDKSPDVRFTYRYGSAASGRFTSEVGPHGTSMGQDRGTGNGVSATRLLRGTRP